MKELRLVCKQIAVFGNFKLKVDGLTKLVTGSAVLVLIYALGASMPLSSRLMGQGTLTLSKSKYLSLSTPAIVITV